MKVLIYLLASIFCAVAVFSETNESVQNSFLAAFVILVTMTLGEFLALKDEG